MKKSIFISQLFVLLCATIWLAFAFVVAAGLHPALPDSVVYRCIMAVLAIMTSVFLLIMFFLLRKKNKISYFLTIIFLIFLTILTIADDLGLIDFIVLSITITPIILLIKDRKWYK